MRSAVEGGVVMGGGVGWRVEMGVEMEMMCGEFEILLAENAKTGRSKYVQVEVFNAGDFYLALKSCSYIILVLYVHRTSHCYSSRLSSDHFSVDLLSPLV
jgi:hypothetical protein